MILAVRANKESFNEVRFDSNFNVIMAERAETSSDKDSRNGVGKSTLVEIIHFCLGSSTTMGKGLRNKELKDWVFTLDFIAHGKEVTVSRSTSSHGYVVIHPDTDSSEWLIKPKYHKRTNEARISISNGDWKRLLGWLFFGLSIDDKRTEAPSFRQLISYKIRREEFDDPFKFYPQQFTGDIQICNAFLLGINWEHAIQWQVLRERSNRLTRVKKMMKDGDTLFAQLIGIVGDLENERLRLQRRVKEEEQRIESFRVHKDYENIARNANDVTEEIHSLTNLVIQNTRLVEFNEKRMEDEKAATKNQVAEIYKSAGVELPHTVVKRIDDVQAFHNEITKNRRQYLNGEIQRLNQENKTARERIEKLSDERAEYMQILNSYGALNDYNNLIQLHTETRTKLNTINNQIERLREIQREDSRIKFERNKLFLDASVDFEEREIVEKALSIFNENSEALYDAPGNLNVYPKEDKGFVFNIDIKRAGSDAVDKMKVFCYDLMIAELWAGSESHPQFLIHDSTLFADVDERQRARALELAAYKSEKFGFQYIVLFNSDNIPHDEFSENFDFESKIRLTLMDTPPERSLLGIRF